MMGFGPIDPTADEPAFHAEWEKRAFGLVLAMGALGQWNIDMSRFARESLVPARYLSASYYEIWLEGLIRLMTMRNLVTPKEVRAGRMLNAPAPSPPALKPEHVPALLARGARADRPAQGPARFGLGASVRAKVMNPKTHTRLPRYLRGCLGEVARVHGAHVFPDSHAQGRGADPQWLYTVRFTARDVWGEGHNARDLLHADLWEPYLEPA